MVRVLVDGNGTVEGWRFTEEAVLNTSFTLSYTTQAAQLVPVTFTIGSFGRALPQLSNLAGFLVLKRLVLIINRSILQSEPRAIGVSDSQTFTIPNGGGAQTHYFIHNCLRWVLSTAAFPTNVSITGATVGNHNSLTPSKVDFAPYALSAAPQSGADFDLGQWFDYQLGFVNPQPLSTFTPFGVAPANQGIDFTITFANTSGSSKTYTMDFFGSDLAFDNAKFTLEYADDNGVHHNIGVYDDHINPAEYQMDLVIPLPLTDPGQTDFGNLVFTLLNAYSAYNSSYTVNVMLTASMAYLTNA